MGGVGVTYGMNKGLSGWVGFTYDMNEGLSGWVGFTYEMDEGYLDGWGLHKPVKSDPETH